MKTRNGLFADVPENLWNDWHWQVANRAETVEDLKKYMNLTPDEEEGVRKTLGKLRMAVTPYYLSLIDLDDPFDPIRKMAIPRAEELEYADYEDADPLHEDTDSPTPGLTHRYPDRVLLLITDQCSMYCRHCTRRRFAGQNDCEVPMAQIDKCIDYVAAHPEVRDVLLSGGDCRWSTSSSAFAPFLTWRSSVWAPAPPWCAPSVSPPSCAPCCVSIIPSG